MTELETIIKELGYTDDGPDKCDLRAGRILDLLYSGLLTDEQFQDLARVPEIRQVQTAYDRVSLARRLCVEGLTDDLFSAFCRLKDSGIQRALLDRDDLRRQHVEWLAQNGGNNAVQNRARQMLASRRFRAEKPQPTKEIASDDGN